MFPSPLDLNASAATKEKNLFIFPTTIGLITLTETREKPNVTLGAIQSTKISGNFGPKLNGSARSNRKSFEKTGPPFEVVLFSRSDRLEFWFNGSRPLYFRERFDLITSTKI